jgi:hypothetical protein
MLSRATTKSVAANPIAVIRVEARRGCRMSRIQRVSESEYPDKPLIGCIDSDGRDLKERRAQSRLVVKMCGDVLRGDDVGRYEEKQAEQG